MMQFAVLLNEMAPAGAEQFAKFLNAASSSDASRAGQWLNSATPAQIKVAAALLNQGNLDEFRKLIATDSPTSLKPLSREPGKSLAGSSREEPSDRITKIDERYLRPYAIRFLRRMHRSHLRSVGLITAIIGVFVLIAWFIGSSVPRPPAILFAGLITAALLIVAGLSLCIYRFYDSMTTDLASRYSEAEALLSEALLLLKTKTDEHVITRQLKERWSRMRTEEVRALLRDVREMAKCMASGIRPDVCLSWDDVKVRAKPFMSLLGGVLCLFLPVAVLFISQLICRGVVSTDVVVGETTKYTRIGWVGGTAISIGFWMIIGGVFWIGGSIVGLGRQEGSGRKAAGSTGGGFLCLVGGLLLFSIPYYYAMMTVVTVHPDGFSVGNWIGEDDEFRFEGIDKLEAYYGYGRRTGQGVSEILSVTTKPGSGKQGGMHSGDKNRNWLFVSSALDAALPEVFRRARAKGAECKDRR